MGFLKNVRKLFGNNKDKHIEVLLHMIQIIQNDNALLISLVNEYFKATQSLQNVVKVYENAWQSVAPFLKEHSDSISKELRLKLSALEDQANTASNDASYRMKRAAEITDEIYKTDGKMLVLIEELNNED